MSQKIKKNALVLDYVILFLYALWTHIWFQQIPGTFYDKFVILFASDILLIKKIITSPVKCYSVVVVCLHVIMATFDLHMNLTHFVFWGRLACFSDNYIWISGRFADFYYLRQDHSLFPAETFRTKMNRY